MKSAIIVFPGSNRENDMRYALSRVTGCEPAMVWHTEATLPDVDLIVLPGGFSFGDYLRPGAIAARSPILTDLVKKAHEGVPILGVCNGFQILTELGLLPGSLMRNASLKFVCREVHLKACNTETLFTRAFCDSRVVRCPVAHHDGNYHCDRETFERLRNENRIAFRYCDASGSPTAEANPNGSLDNIAGILNETGTVLGMMPHPENLVSLYQGGTDGAKIFESLAKAAA